MNALKSDCFGDHWEEHLAFDSQMSAILTVDPIPFQISPLL
jgi:hypothetical protein